MLKLFKKGKVTPRTSTGATGAMLARQSLIQTIRLMAGAVIVTSLISTIVLGFSIWVLLNKPSPIYFATRTDGELVHLVPLNEPHLSSTQILHFATQAITRANTFDFAHYKTQLTEVRQYFTDEGFDAFVKDLNDSGNLQLVIERRMTTSAVANGGSIIAQGRTGNRRDGTYLWRVQVPLVVTYESSQERQTQNLIVQVDITRVPTWSNSWGVAVKRFVTRSER